MSEWLEQKKEDISFSDKKDEMHIYIESDDFGARYVSVNIKDVIEKLKEKKII